MEDDMSTPIQNILNTETTEHHEQQTLPMPTVQSFKQMPPIQQLQMHTQQEQPKQEKKEDNKYEEVQKDVILLTVISVMIQSSMFQKLLYTYLPALFNEGILTQIGMVFNGLMIGILYIMLKKVNIGIKN